MNAHVTIGYDGSDPARDALALGRMLADALNAPIKVASVYPPVAVESHMGGASRRPDERSNVGCLGG